MSTAAVGHPCRGVLHTPPMFPLGNNSARQASAAVGNHFGGERTSSAIVGRPYRGAKAYAPMFMAENNSARQVSAAIGKHFRGEWVSSAHKMVSDRGE